MLVTNELSVAVAEKWGPALTKCIREGDVADFRDLFIADEPVVVVVQNSAGDEIHSTIGDAEGAEVSWGEFDELIKSDLQEQNFLRAESQCLGKLGDRILLEGGRFNENGELYHESYSLLTLNENGKITMVEIFTDLNAQNLFEGVGKSTE